MTTNEVHHTKPMTKPALPAPKRDPGGLMLLFSYGRDFIETHRIVVLRSERNYTHIYFYNGGEHLSSFSLCSLLSKLPPDAFIRIHNAYAVNRAYIKSVGKTCVVLIDGSRWVISRRKLKEVHSLLASTGN